MLVRTMTTKHKQILILLVVVLATLKFRNQILSVLARVPVLGPLLQ